MEPEDEIVETTEDTVAPFSGALSLADAAKAYQTQQKLVEKQIRDNMSVLMGARDKLRQQRVGPSTAERLFAISAALGRPTRTGTLGETMGNLSTVLGEQEKAMRAEEMEREALLAKYAMQIGNEQLRLLQQGLTGAGQVYRGAQAAEAAANRIPSVIIGADSIPREPKTGLPVATPKPEAYAALENNPTPENLNAMVNAYPRFKELFVQAYTKGRRKFNLAPAGGR